MYVELGNIEVCGWIVGNVADWGRIFIVLKRIYMYVYVRIRIYMYMCVDN